MAMLSQVASELIGRRAVDAGGRRLGRVIAVIHKARGADVLIEGRVWLRRRTHRCSIDNVTISAAGTVVVSAGAVHAGAANAREAM